MKKILGLGNALTDILFQVEDDTLLKKLNLSKGGMHLIENDRSEQIKALFGNAKPTMATGGSASNTINGIAKLGAQSGFVGKISDDAIGRFFAENSLENGVTPHMLFSKTPSGHCTVLVSADSERTLCTYLGAASELRADDLQPTLFDGYNFFHVEGYLVQNHQLIQSALKTAKDAGLTTSIDMASFNVVQEHLDFLHKMVGQYVDIIFANEDEARVFTGKPPREAVEIMAGMCDIAVVKIGKAGSYIMSHGELHTVQPFEAQSVDTTGAGDLYAAGFLYGLANDLSVEVCGKIGSLVSSKVVEVVGTKMEENTWSAIKQTISKWL